MPVSAIAIKLNMIILLGNFQLVFWPLAACNLLGFLTCFFLPFPILKSCRCIRRLKESSIEEETEYDTFNLLSILIIRYNYQ